MFDKQNFLEAFSKSSLIIERYHLFQKLFAEYHMSLVKDYKYMSAREMKSFCELINSLPASSRFEAIKKQDESGNTLLHYAIITEDSDVMALIINIYPENVRFNEWMIKNIQGCNVWGWVEEPECLRILMNALNTNERFEMLRVLQENLDDQQQVKLFPEIKEMILTIIDKDYESGFEQIRQRITAATTYDDLKEPLQELNCHYIKLKQALIKSNINAHKIDKDNENTLSSMLPKN